MYKLTAVAAAIAAGMLSFTVTAQAEPLSFRKEQPLVATTSPAKAKSAEAKPAKAKSAKTVAAKETKMTTTNKRSGKRRVVRKKVLIDTTTTASIPAAKAAEPSQPAAGSKSYGAIVARHAVRNGVPVGLAHAVIKIESNYRPLLTGRAGEVGLMQIKPATARMLGYTGSVKGLYDPETNIKYGMKYLAMAQNLGGGTICGTILKYNAGHGAKRMNPVSSAYCSKVKIQLAAAATSA
jgi:soluble lytic murein transglycosylase-like protein